MDLLKRPYIGGNHPPVAKVLLNQRLPTVNISHLHVVLLAFDASYQVAVV